MGDWAAVARVVNERMQDRQMTQRELAEKSGISPATLRQIQQGQDRQRSRSTLAAISRALGLPEDYLKEISVGSVGNASGAPEASAVESLRLEIADLRQRVESIETRMRQ